MILATLTSSMVTVERKVILHDMVTSFVLDKMQFHARSCSTIYFDVFEGILSVLQFQQWRNRNGENLLCRF